MELWDAYSKEEERIGVTLIRGEEIPQGLYHLVCEVLVRHTDGSFLCMKRSVQKPNYGGWYEATAGGSALAGENKWQCIERELYEETGYQGRIDRIGTPSYSSPGLSGEQIIPVWMTIDRRQYPEPPESHPESTESIEVFPLYPDEVTPFLDAAIARGDGIDTKVLLLYHNGGSGM